MGERKRTSGVTRKDPIPTTLEEIRADATAHLALASKLDATVGWLLLWHEVPARVRAARRSLEAAHTAIAAALDEKPAPSRKALRRAHAAARRYRACAHELAGLAGLEVRR